MKLYDADWSRDVKNVAFFEGAMWKQEADIEFTKKYSKFLCENNPFYLCGIPVKANRRRI